MCFAFSTNDAPPCARALFALLNPGTTLPPESCEPAALVNLAFSHRLHGVLLHVQENASVPRPAWVDDALARIKNLRPAERARWVLQAAAARGLNAAFKASGVRAVFLKGFAYATELYTSPELRPFNDLDVLVAEADLEKSAKVLASAGYQRGVKQRVFGAMEESFQREVAKGTVLEVDLHWDLVGRESLNRAMNLRPSDFLARSIERLDGVRVLAPEDAMVFAAVNLVVHGYSPLQQFYDLALMANKPPDWSRVLERASACRVRSALGAGLAVAEACFGVRVPDDVRAGLTSPGWQRAVFAKLLRAGHLVRPERFCEFGARYALKVLSQDSLGAALGTLAYQPLRLLKRLAYRPASPR